MELERAEPAAEDVSIVLEGPLSFANLSVRSFDVVEPLREAELWCTARPCRDSGFGCTWGFRRGGSGTLAGGARAGGSVGGTSGSINSSSRRCFTAPLDGAELIEVVLY
jgi:hypothetical protein